jgi:hypothetical protein
MRLGQDYGDDLSVGMGEVGAVERMRPERGETHLLTAKAPEVETVGRLEELQAGEVGEREDDATVRGSGWGGGVANTGEAHTCRDGAGGIGKEQ